MMSKEKRIDFPSVLGMSITPNICDKVLRCLSKVVTYFIHQIKPAKGTSIYFTIHKIRKFFGESKGGIEIWYLKKILYQLADLNLIKIFDRKVRSNGYARKIVFELNQNSPIWKIVKENDNDDEIEVNLLKFLIKKLRLEECLQICSRREYQSLLRTESS